MRAHVATSVLLILVLVAAPLAASSPYIVITPGGAYELGPRVHVPDEVRQPTGRIAFTAVFEQDATWAQVIRARLVQVALGLPPESGPRGLLQNVTGVSEAVPREQIRPPGVSQEQVNQQNKRAIDESKPVAAVVGLRAAGLDASITGQGAEVLTVVSGKPADGVLLAGDIIVQLDSMAVRTAADLVAGMRRHAPGDTVTLTVVRDGLQRDLTVGTMPSPTEPLVPLVGITIATHGFDVHLPFPVEMDSGDVGGPSAGLMFALAVLDAVTPGDLTRGYFVAGTGTISADGQVGPIGGVAEKVAAAEQAGAQLFLSPRDNYAEAVRVARHIQVVSVSSLDAAIAALCGRTPADGVAAEPPAPCPSTPKG